MRSSLRPTVRSFSFHRASAYLLVSFSFALLFAPCTFAQMRERSRSEANWPVPVFNGSYDKPGQRKIADELRSAYKALHTHICNKPTPVTESWKSRYRTLLMQLIVAQHKTVWADSGNETQRDTNRLYGFFNSKEKIGELLRNAVRNNPGGAVEVNEYLAASQARFNELVKAAEVDFGRRAFLVQALRIWLAETNRDMSSIIPRYHIRLADYQAFRNAAAKSLETTHQEIYRSAIASVTRRVPAGAQTFDLFYPAERDPNYPLSDENGRLLSDAIAKGNSAVTGKTFDLAAYYSMTGEYYQGYSSTPFSESGAKQILGECESMAVQIFYDPSRKEDAGRAEEILRQNGFLTGSHVTGQADTYKGHIYIPRNGNRNEAARVAGLIKNIETVSPIEQPERTSAYYALYLGSKDDEVKVDELSWETSFHYYGHFADPIKKRHSGRCPATTPPGSFRGAEGGPTYYSPASGICIAGVHAGLITFERGGVLTWAYDEAARPRTIIGSTRFGVTSGTLDNFPVFWYFIR